MTRSLFATPRSSNEPAGKRADFLNAMDDLSDSDWDYGISAQPSEGGHEETIHGLATVPDALFALWAASIENPNRAILPVRLILPDRSRYDVRVVFEDNGPLAVLFDDSTRLTYEFRSTKSDELGPEQSLRIQIESIVTLLDLTGFIETLPPEDQAIAESIKSLLSDAAVAENPPRDVIREGLRWIRRKLDRLTDQFVDAMGSSVGATAGVAVTTAAAAALHHPYFEMLSNQITHLLRALGG